LRPIALSVACFALALLLTPNLFAQQPAAATLSGRVLDPNGAVIPGAQVTATQKATGVKRETTTNDEGVFVIPNLPVGGYEVVAQATNFKTKVIAVTLQVGQTMTLDMKLDIASFIIVDNFGDELLDLINNSTSVVDSVINHQEVENLPLNGRNFLELALLIPGNSPAPNFDPTKTNTVVISSAGQLGRGGNVTVDGADDNDDVVGGAVQNISQEAVQEFQIATNRFSAQLGRSGSSVVNIVTKSGTNEFHGSGSFYFRNRSLQGLPATFDRSLSQTPPFDREQYAFALGGPIKRNKAFFFGSFEYRNQDGAVLAGARNLASRSITRSFAPAPLNDLLTTNRIDWNPNGNGHLHFRYSLEREDDVAASTLIRSIGSASQRHLEEWAGRFLSRSSALSCCYSSSA